MIYTYGNKYWLWRIKSNISRQKGKKREKRSINKENNVNLFNVFNILILYIELKVRTRSCGNICFYFRLFVLKYSVFIICNFLSNL